LTAGRRKHRRKRAMMKRGETQFILGCREFWHYDSARTKSV